MCECELCLLSEMRRVSLFPSERKKENPENYRKKREPTKGEPKGSRSRSGGSSGPGRAPGPSGSPPDSVYFKSERRDIMELVKSVNEGPVYGVISRDNRVKICVDLEDCESWLLDLTQTEARKMAEGLLKLLKGAV